MAYLRMSFGNASVTALLFISYVAGIISTVGSRVEQVAYSLADVTYMRRFESEIRSSEPEWYCEGMQIFAFTHTRFYWEKKDLTWALVNTPVNMTAQNVISYVEAAFVKWAEESRFDFQRIPYAQGRRPDILIEFISSGPHFRSHMIDPTNSKMDDEGVTLQFSNSKIWTVGDVNSRWCNLWFVALYEIGHALGLGDSNNKHAVMYKGYNRGIDSPKEPFLDQDDIDGIKEKYSNNEIRRRRNASGPSS